MDEINAKFMEAAADLAARLELVLEGDNGLCVAALLLLLSDLLETTSLNQFPSFAALDAHIQPLLVLVLPDQQAREAVLSTLGKTRH